MMSIICCFYAPKFIYYYLLHLVFLFILFYIYLNFHMNILHVFNERWNLLFSQVNPIAMSVISYSSLSSMAMWFRLWSKWTLASVSLTFPLKMGLKFGCGFKTHWVCLLCLLIRIIDNMVLHIGDYSYYYWVINHYLFAGFSKGCACK